LLLAPQQEAQATRQKPGTAAASGVFLQRLAKDRALMLGARRLWG